MRAIGRQLHELYRRGFALFALAPVIVAIVVLPEWLQHSVEIRIGMFDSVERARALASDSQRWAFGNAKLAGLLVAMLAAARYWRGLGSWWDLRRVAWLRMLLGLALFVGISAIVAALEGRVPGAVYWTAYVVLSIAVLPLYFAILGAWFGERRPGAVESLWRGWRGVPLLILLLVAAYLPAMAAHYGLHHLALGRAAPLVWGLMALDGLVVGLLAALVGAAFALAYDAAYPASRPA